MPKDIECDKMLKHEISYGQEASISIWSLVVVVAASMLDTAGEGKQRNNFSP